jgi:hypothetical protein
MHIFNAKLFLLRWEIESWVEQCYRYVLRIVWNLTEPSQLHTFNRLVPIDRPIAVNFTCCQNFLLSRAMVQRRPLHVWQKLYTVITQQDVCREGEIDYKNMFSNMTKLGPERPFKHGRDTQGTRFIILTYTNRTQNTHVQLCNYNTYRDSSIFIYTHMHFYTYTAATKFAYIQKYIDTYIRHSKLLQLFFAMTRKCHGTSCACGVRSPTPADVPAYHGLRLPAVLPQLRRLSL